MRDPQNYLDLIKNAMDAFNAKNYQDVIENCEIANRINPAGSEALFLLGCASQLIGRLGTAMSLYRRAVELDPDIREYAETLGSQLIRVGHLTEGLYYSKLATALPPHPEFPNFVPTFFRDLSEAVSSMMLSLYYSEAVRAEENRDFGTAVIKAREELLLNPDHIEASRLLARNLVYTHRYSQAEATVNARLHSHDASPDDYRILANALWHLGRRDAAASVLEFAANQWPDEWDAQAAAIDQLPYCGPGFAAPRAKSCAALKRLIDEVERFPRDPEGIPEGRPIRVAVLADSLHDSFESAAVEVVLRGLAAAGIETFVYQMNVAKDPTTSRLANLTTNWREVYDLDEETFADIIGGDEIDALLDLCGLGVNRRLQTLAIHSAQLNIGWIRGEPAGIPAYDIVLGDPVTRDSDTALLADGQRWIGLDHLYAFIPSAATDIAPAPCEDMGAVTFGTVADLGSISPDIVCTWARILKRIPNAHIVFGCVPNVSSGVVSEIIDRFGNYGLAARVSFQPGVLENSADDTDRHTMTRQFLSSIDILLDGSPVSVGALAKDALWAGVPVVTCPGQSRASSIAAVLLRAAGQEAWICADPDAYVEVACGLATDLEELAALRGTLRSRIEKSAMFNSTAFGRSLTKAIVEALGGRPHD